jgi:hypothetical protein
MFCGAIFIPRGNQAWPELIELGGHLGRRIVTTHQMLRHAAECRQLAAVERHPETERILLEVAREWEHMARWRAAFDRRRPEGAVSTFGTGSNQSTAA